MVEYHTSSHGLADWSKRSDDTSNMFADDHEEMEMNDKGPVAILQANGCRGGRYDKDGEGRRCIGRRDPGTICNEMVVESRETRPHSGTVAG
jgi:hypothetical protein